MPEIDWGINTEELPQDEVNEWEFNVKHANDNGESDNISARIDPALGRMIDELIQESKASGLPLKTRSDFSRLAVFRLVNDLRTYLNSQDERIAHYMLLEKQSMAEAVKSEMLERVLKSVQQLTKGMVVLAERRQDWREINKRITNWLKPIMEMKDSEPFLAKLYISELFEYNKMSDVLGQLKSNRRMSKTIRDAKKFYES